MRKWLLRYFGLPIVTCTAPALSAQHAVCRSPIGIPCSTITYVQTEWQMVSLSSGLITHRVTQSENAHRSDGSAMSMYEPGQIEIYSASSDQIIRVNSLQRTVSHRPPIIWHDRPYRHSKDGDSQCATAILHLGTDFHQSGEAVVSGVAVKIWERGDGWYWHEEEDLAPSLDCANLKSSLTRRNQYWIPTSIRSTEATSVRMGEPDLDLFSVPADYREVIDPREKFLREFLLRNQSAAGRSTVESHSNPIFYLPSPHALSSNPSAFANHTPLPSPLKATSARSTVIHEQKAKHQFRSQIGSKSSER